MTRHPTTKRESAEHPCGETTPDHRAHRPATRRSAATWYGFVVNLVDELHAVSSALANAGIRHAICGGVAVTIHGATRSTKDIDVLVAPGDVPRVLEVVRPLGYAFAALPIVFDEGTSKERHVQRVSKIVAGQHLILDFLLATASLSGFLEGAIAITLPEGPLMVVSRDTLLKMKRLAGRAQDLADIEKLEVPDGE